jgi:hypothetical protein
VLQGFPVVSDAGMLRVCLEAGEDADPLVPDCELEQVAS